MISSRGTTPPKPRQKRFTRRSRTGCRTCRARHVKCDETPGSCQNCKAAGWVCEGYDVNQPKHSDKEKSQQLSASIPSPTLQLLCNNVLRKNPDEWRAFAFFQASTVPKMAGLFESPLWNNVVLPMSYTEPAVSHAIIAMSTLQEEVERHGAPLSRENLGKNSHRFALEQYGRALSALNQRQHQQDPKLREVVLTCCLLFVIFELLRGQYDPALLHLQNGLSIIRANKIKGISSGAGDIDEPLAEAMARLDVHSVFFGVRKTLPESDTKHDVAVGDSFRRRFFTLAEARRKFDDVSHSVYRFIGIVNSWSREGSLPDNVFSDLKGQKDALSRELAGYMRNLEQSKPLLLPPDGKRERRSFDLIRLHHMTLSALLETYMDDDQIIDSDAFLDLCDGIVDLAEQIVQSIRAECGSEQESLPSLSLDTGIIPSLLYVCGKCPHIPVRLRALQLLDSWPHREGLWDSNLAAALARHLLAIETEAETQRLSAAGTDSTALNPAYISAESRVQHAFLSVADDQRHAVITYGENNSEKEGTKRERVVLLDENP